MATIGDIERLLNNAITPLQTQNVDLNKKLEQIENALELYNKSNNTAGKTTCRRRNHHRKIRFKNRGVKPTCI